MPDCISQASEIVIMLSWSSFLLIVAGFLWALKNTYEKRPLFSVLLVMIAHPILWSRGEGQCETPLWKSSLLFFILGIGGLLWSQFRTNNHVNER